jgi:hypothetical protein
MGRDDVKFGRWKPTFWENSLSPFSSIFMVTEEGSNESLQDAASYPPNSRSSVLEYRNVQALVLPPKNWLVFTNFIPDFFI